MRFALLALLTFAAQAQTPTCAVTLSVAEAGSYATEGVSLVVLSAKATCSNLPDPAVLQSSVMVWITFATPTGEQRRGYPFPVKGSGGSALIPMLAEESVLSAVSVVEMRTKERPIAAP